MAGCVMNGSGVEGGGGGAASIMERVAAAGKSGRTPAPDNASGESARRGSIVDEHAVHPHRPDAGGRDVRACRGGTVRERCRTPVPAHARRNACKMLAESSGRLSLHVVRRVAPGANEGAQVSNAYCTTNT